MEGKKTYLFLKALEKAKGNNKRLLKLVIKNKGIQKNEIPEYQDIYRRLGVIDDAQKEIKNYTNKALKSLVVLKKMEDRKLFHSFADYLLSRNK